MIGQALSYVHSDGKWIPCVVLWALWRIWMFTIRPRLRKDEVDVLPYNIPFLGHAISLFRDPLGLYGYAHEHFKKTRSPYAIHTAGQITVVVTDPQQAAEILNNGDSYTADPFLDALYRTVGGVSIDGSRTLWRIQLSDGDSPRLATDSKIKTVTLVQKCHNILLRHLQTSSQAQAETSSKALSLIDAATRNGIPSAAQISSSHRKDDIKVVSLHRWCRDVLVNHQIDLFFGPSLVGEIEPDAISLLDCFDANSWMLAYQYPSFLAQRATMPRENLIRALQTYLDTLQTDEDDTDGHAPLFASVVDEMQNAGLSHEDCARVLLVMFWEINAAVQMTAFWMLTHLLQPENTNAVDMIRKEIAPVMVTHETQSLAGLGNSGGFKREMFGSSSCPVLNSLHSQVVQVFNTSAPVRVTTRPVSLASTSRDGSSSEMKIIPANTKIVLPQRMIALSPELFGPNANRCVDPYRSVTPKEKSTDDLAQGFNMRYGSTALAEASAKTVGKSTVLGFVAFVLWRYDLQGVPKGRLAKDGVTPGIGVPEMALKKPSLGVSRQADGDDVVVEVRKRW